MKAKEVDFSMNTTNLQEHFLEDAAVFTENLTDLLFRLEENPDNRSLVNQIFRHIHSLKSEAAYLHYEEIAEEAHKLESLLEDVRRDNATAGTSVLNSLFSGLDRIQEQIHKLPESGGSDTETAVRIAEEPEAPKASSAGSSFIFSDFEKAILQEAFNREETLFHLTVDLERATPLKYPKAFLIINNLELLVNVIRVTPSFSDKGDDEKFRHFQVLFTGDQSEEKIRKALNVDQVERVTLTPMEINHYLDSEGITGVEAEVPAALPEDRSVRIDASRLEELHGLVEELKIRLSGWHGDESGTLLKEIIPYLDGMSGILKAMRLAGISSEFHRLKRLVRDLSGKLKKPAGIKIISDESRVERRILQSLMEILTHLVRNAMDHGIESPEERKQAGKAEQGILILQVETREGDLHISLIDDGAGINENVVRQAAALEGLDENLPMFDILAVPGFSLSDNVTDLSGRGVGLDLVADLIKEIPGATIKLDSIPGKSTTFEITIPRKVNMKVIMLGRSGNDTIAIEDKYILESGKIEKDQYSTDRGFLYAGLPVYSVRGRIIHGGEYPSQNYFLKISYRGNTGILLLDELLFEQEIPGSQFTMLEEVTPHLYRVRIAGREAEFRYLHGAILSR